MGIARHVTDDVYCMQNRPPQSTGSLKFGWLRDISRIGKRHRTLRQMESLNMDRAAPVLIRIDH